MEVQEAVIHFLKQWAAQRFTPETIILQFWRHFLYALTLLLTLAPY